MISAFTRSLRQLPDPAFRRVVVRSVALAAVVNVALWGVLFWFLSDLGSISIFGWDIIPRGAAVKAFTGMATFAVTQYVASLTFVAVVSIFIGFFIEDVADAVEKRYYPSDPPGRGLSFFKSLRTGLRFTGVLVVANVLALPIYAIDLIPFIDPPVPYLNFFVFYGMNGYLVSREYFEIVAHRHMDDLAAAYMRKAHQWRLFPVGILITFAFTLPVVNFFVPLLAAASMTHIFKDLWAQRPAQSAV